MTARREFSRSTKIKIWERAGGRCEGRLEDGSRCTKKFFPGDRREFHHVIECHKGGSNDASNGELLCGPCHDALTKADAPERARGNKAKARHVGARTVKYPVPKHPTLVPMPGGGLQKRDPVTKKATGEWVREPWRPRDEE